jgi:PGF-pre-PGF domain-containing protein
VKITFNKKGLMKFGIIVSVVLGLFFAGSLLYGFISPTVADDFGLNNSINVTLGSPGNDVTLTIANATVALVNFTFIPVWADDVVISNCALWGNFSSGPDDWSLNATNETELVNGALNGISILVNQSTFVWNINCTDSIDQFDYDLTNYTATVTLVPPIINNTLPTNNTYVKGTSAQVFQAYFYDYSLDTSNVNVSYANVSSEWTNSSLTCYDISTYAGVNASFICNTTVNLNSSYYPEGNTINYYFTATDAGGGVGFNGTKTGNISIIIDRTPPTYSNLVSSVTNATTIRRGSITLSMQWSDNMVLDYWGNVTNLTGSRVDTNSTFTSGNWTNITYDTTVCDTPHVNCPVYAIVATNDSAGNQNLTYFEWTIGNVCGDGYCDAGEVCPSDCSGFGYETASPGGGGGGAVISGVEFSQTAALANSTLPAIINVDPTKASTLKVDQVTVEVNDAVTNVKVTVKESTLPTGANLAISTDEGATYKYLSITSTVPSENLDKVTIKFKVEKSWITNNNIDTSTIALERYANSQWNKLTTTLVNQDSTYYYFEAVSPGLSIFAIIGAKTSEVTTPTTSTQQCPTCESPTEWNDCIDNKQTRTNYKCSADTNYQCQSYTETRDCVPIISQVEQISWIVILAWVVAIGGLIVIIWLIVRRKKHTRTNHHNHQ